MQHKMKKLRNRLGVKVTLIFIGIVFALLIGESVLRRSNKLIFNPGDFNDIRAFIYSHEDLGLCSKDSELYWRLNKGRLPAST